MSRILSFLAFSLGSLAVYMHDLGKVVLLLAYSKVSRYTMVLLRAGIWTVSGRDRV